MWPIADDSDSPSEDPAGHAAVPTGRVARRPAGVGPRSLTDRESDAAFWATWHDLRVSVPAAARALGCPLMADASGRDAEEAAARRRAAGIELQEGAPAQPTVEVLQSPWAADAPPGAELVTF